MRKLDDFGTKLVIFMSLHTRYGMLKCEKSYRKLTFCVIFYKRVFLWQEDISFGFG